MTLETAIEKLGCDFLNLNWSFVEETINEKKELVSYWPGDPKEDIMVCVLNSNHIDEHFHRQDFFFLNFAYRGNYQALSSKFDNAITIHENECYIGQPFSGYALKGDYEKNIVIFGVLIKKNTFFREFLPSIASDNLLFRFFLDAQKNKFSDEFIHLKFSEHHPIRTLLELMVSEYANKNQDTQAVLKPMTLSVLMHVAREFRRLRSATKELSLSEQMVQFISEHITDITLKDISIRFSYHPNYISNFLRQKTGLTFSEILLRLRMERAIYLLKGTTLSVEEIAAMLGYLNTSNFYRAFRAHYHVSPRNYQKSNSLTSVSAGTSPCLSS